MWTMATGSDTKAATIHLLAEEIATGIQSVEAVANRCWRKKIISNKVYKEVLRPNPSNESHGAVKILLKAVEASIREEQKHFDDFLEILRNELEPEVAKNLISKITYHLEESLERINLDQSTEDGLGQDVAVGNTSTSKLTPVSNECSYSTGKGVDASGALRRRKRLGSKHTGLVRTQGSPTSDEKQGTLCEQDATAHAGIYDIPQSAKVEPDQNDNEMSSTSNISGAYTNLAAYDLERPHLLRDSL